MFLKSTKSMLRSTEKKLLLQALADLLVFMSEIPNFSWFLFMADPLKHNEYFLEYLSLKEEEDLRTVSDKRSLLALLKKRVFLLLITEKEILINAPTISKML